MNHTDASTINALTSVLFALCIIVFFIAGQLVALVYRMHQLRNTGEALAKKYKVEFDCYQTWHKHGYDMGWCGPQVCLTHDGAPMTNKESEEDEPCIHIIRLYEDHEIKKAVEEDHAPSKWRWPAGEQT